MHKVVLEVQRPVNCPSNSARQPPVNRQFLHQPLKQQPPVLGRHNIQPTRNRRHQQGSEMQQDRPALANGNGDGSPLQQFVRSDSEPLMTSSAERCRSAGPTMPGSFTLPQQKQQQQQQPEWQRSNSLSRQRVAWNDPQSGSSRAKDRTDRAATTRINYGWVDPGDDNEDDDDESDKENKPTFPRSFRPAAGRQTQRNQQSAHHQMWSSNAVSTDPSAGEPFQWTASRCRTFSGDSLQLTAKFDQFVCDDRDLFADVTLDRSNQHVVEFRGCDRRPRTHGHLGTIEEVTELSSCSAGALHSLQQSALDVADVDGCDVEKSMTMENTYENNAMLCGSPAAAGGAAQAADTSAIMDTSPSSDGSNSPAAGLEAFVSPVSINDDDDDIDQRSLASTVDASVTVERPQFCSGVLTLASGKSRFGKIGLVDLYKQRRRKHQQRGRRDGTDVREAAAADSSVDDGADWMSIASGCSSLADAPPAKRQRLNSFKVHIYCDQLYIDGPRSFLLRPF